MWKGIPTHGLLAREAAGWGLAVATVLKGKGLDFLY